MTEPNPYQPPSTAPEKQRPNLEVPVRFGGKLGVQDLEVWCPRNDLGSVLQSLRSNWVLLVLAGGVGALGIRQWWWGGTFYPISMLALGALVMPFYTYLSTSVMRWWFDSVEKTRDHLTGSRPCKGYFDEEGGCWQDDLYIARFPWSEAYVWHTGDAVGVSFWGSNANFYLPSRFFESEDEFHRLRLYLTDLQSNGSPQPMLPELSGQTFGSTQCMTFEEVGRARQWSEAIWPFECQNEEPLTWDFESSWSDWKLSERLRYLGAHIVWPTLNWLPIHLAFWGWIVVRRIQANHRDGVLDEPTGALTVLVYTLSVSAYAYAQVRRHIKHRWIQRQPARLWFDPAGTLTKQGDHYVWVAFCKEMQVICDAEHLGWKSLEVEDFFAQFSRKKMTPEFEEKLEAILKASVMS